MLKWSSHFWSLSQWKSVNAKQDLGFSTCSMAARSPSLEMFLPPSQHPHASSTERSKSEEKSPAQVLWEVPPREPGCSSHVHFSNSGHHCCTPAGALVVFFLWVILSLWLSTEKCQHCSKVLLVLLKMDILSMGAEAEAPSWSSVFKGHASWCGGLLKIH